MNMAIDREAILREGLNGHGVVSTGPVWPHNYAFSPRLPHFAYDVRQASQLLSEVPHGSQIRQFTCIVRPDAVAERIALVVKRQLQAVDRDVNREMLIDKQIAAVKTGKFQAALMEIVSGPTLLRPYQLWHSKGFLNIQISTVDVALDQIRYSASADDYKKAVGNFQQAMIDDPPAIFLAWMSGHERSASSSTFRRSNRTLTCS